MVQCGRTDVGDICILTVDSHRYTAETNMILCWLKVKRTDIKS